MIWAADSPPVMLAPGLLRLFYYNSTNGSIRHAWSNATGWHFETLDGAGNISIGKSTDNVGLNATAIQYDNSLQLFYNDTTNNTLLHAWSNATGWHFETLDGSTSSDSKYSGNVGINVSATINNGSLQVLYFNMNDGTLRHAWTSLTSPWQFEDLDSNVIYPQ